MTETGELARRVLTLEQLIITLERRIVTLERAAQAQADRRDDTFDWKAEGDEWARRYYELLPEAQAHAEKAQRLARELSACEAALDICSRSKTPFESAVAVRKLELEKADMYAAFEEIWEHASLDNMGSPVGGFPIDMAEIAGRMIYKYDPEPEVEG